METEGVVDALRNVHRLVRRGGLVLDLHPGPPHSIVEKDGRPLGELDETAFFATLAAMEERVAEVVAAGLLEPVGERRFDVAERWDTAEDLLAQKDSEADTEVPDELRAAILATPPPLDLHIHVFLRSFRVC